MAQVFSVPVVFPNTRQDDSLFQIFDALEGLESVVEDVFGRIKNRVCPTQFLTSIDFLSLIAKNRFHTKRAESMPSPRESTPPRYSHFIQFYSLLLYKSIAHV
jgi:hypothetical protein